LEAWVFIGCISQGSAAELRTQAYIARKTDLITNDEMKQITNETKEIARMIAGLIKPKQ
jgi:four helix bundle protein